MCALHPAAHRSWLGAKSRNRCPWSPHKGRSYPARGGASSRPASSPIYSPRRTRGTRERHALSLSVNPLSPLHRPRLLHSIRPRVPSFRFRALLLSTFSSFLHPPFLCARPPFPYLHPSLPIPSFQSDEDHADGSTTVPAPGASAIRRTERGRNCPAGKRILRRFDAAQYRRRLGARLDYEERDGTAKSAPGSTSKTRSRRSTLCAVRILGGE
ncbi:hypothetical protein C8R45DRAFT_999025 [Mycena sanguinolenta]|nr:hypothetical protein C8R45DRAFT_999025 [Mycena sanguinolenta]